MLKLREIRNAKGFTTSELASQVGISQSYYSHLENGRRPLSPELADKIARVLGVATDEVLKAAREVELDSDRLNSWIGNIRINQVPFVKAFGYYLKDRMVDLKSEEDLKKLTVDFINMNIGTSVRTELEENSKLMKRLLPKLESIVGKKLI